LLQFRYLSIFQDSGRVFGRAFGGLYHCAKFGWNQRSSFDNMHVFQFRQFGWRTPIHAPKNGFLGDLTPKWGRHINETPKGTSFGRTTSYDIQIVKIGPPVRPVPKRPKKERKTKKHKGGKLGIRRDHPVVGSN